MHSEARRHAEIYTQDQDGNTKLIARLKERRFKSRNRKISRKASLQKSQPNNIDVVEISRGGCYECYNYPRLSLGGSAEIY